MDVTNAPVEPVDVEKVAGENPQSRFRILDTAILKPGVCALCGSSGGDGRQFVDFGKTMEWYGVVYFCTYCIAEAATLIGFAFRRDLDKEINTLQNGCSEREEKLRELEEQLNAARRLLRNCNCSDADSSSAKSNPVSVDVEFDVEGFDSIADNNESGSFEGIDNFPSPPELADSKPKRTRRTSSSAE